MTPESKLKNDCLKYIKQQRAAGVPVCALKVAGGPRQQSGQPDLIICFAGRFYAVELKRPGEDATPLQAHRLAEWLQAGATVGVAHSVDELVAILGS